MTALRAGFGSKLAWLAGPGEPIVVVGRRPVAVICASGRRSAVGASLLERG